jgi:hypothetical protein
MPLIDSATLVIGAGNFFVAPVGTPCPDPEDYLTPPTPWVNVGHTSLEDIMAFESEGGEATILGTLQNRALRTTYSQRTDSFNISLQQFTAQALSLYFGSNGVVTDDNLFQVPTNPVPTASGFLAVFIDQANAFVVHAPKSELFRADNIEISDTESLVSLPLKITPLQYQTNEWTYQMSALV